VIIISDPHLDDGTGPFSHNHNAFMRFLDLVGNKDLVIAGDFLDLWRWKAEDIIKSNIKIIRRIKQKKNVVLVLGNHDLDIEIMRDIFPGKTDIQMKIEAYGYTIFHGYQIDPMLDDPRERFFAKWGARIIQTINDPNLNRLVEYLTASHRSNDRLKKQIAKKFPLDTKIICGHSHIAEQSDNFLNCGTWTGNRLPYIELDSEKAVLMEFTP
jgi:UDP-2,3-diacylglucosamine pyrophosphatase LpxH